MRNDFRSLRQQQLDRSLEHFQAARDIPRPPKGWIRAIREALGISSGELAKRMGTSRQLPLQLEKSEAEDRITLKSLRAVANALECDLVYSLVPRATSLAELAESRELTKARKLIARVEHSMALENQAAGRLDEAVEAEVRRALRREAR